MYFYKIIEADVLVVGTPTYKGSYTGLFKHAIDLIDPGALLGKPVILTATGGGDRHALIVEHQLRPLFSFLRRTLCRRQSTPPIETSSTTVSRPNRSDSVHNRQSRSWLPLSARRERRPRLQPSSRSRVPRNDDIECMSKAGQQSDRFPRSNPKRK